MLSAEEWWGIMEAYGAKVWPAQAIFFLVAVALVLFLFVKPGKASNILMKLYLVFSFGWNGIVFFTILGRGLAGDYSRSSYNRDALAQDYSHRRQYGSWSILKR